MSRSIIVSLLLLAEYLSFCAGDAAVFSQRWREGVANKNLLEPMTDFTIVPRPVESHNNERELQDLTAPLCGSILQTIFARDVASLDTCTCQVNANNPLEYILTCDYSKECGTFCSDAIGSYDCFDRLDTYTVQVTEKFYINTQYRGCGTYVKEGTTVCLTENRNQQGKLSDRCLDIDGLSCQCHEALCGKYVFQCFHPQTSSPWETFVLNECDEHSYKDIEAGQVEGLLSSNVFSLTDCFDGWTRSPVSTPAQLLTMKPTMHPDRLPVSDNLLQQKGVIETSTPTLSPIREPTAAPTLQSTLKPSTGPTFAPSTTLSGAPTMAPTTSQPSFAPSMLPTIYPSFYPTYSLPTATPSRSQTPTFETIDLDLEPFTLVFAVEANHTSWHPPSMVRAVQQLLVNELRQPFRGQNFATGMHDFRLQCGWVDTTDIVGQANETRLECVGHATFRAKEKPPEISGAALANAEANILLQDEPQLSVLLSNRLGKSVRVIRVDIDKSIQYDETEGPSSAVVARSSAGICSVTLATAVPIVYLILVDIVQLL